MNKAEIVIQDGTYTDKEISTSITNVIDSNYFRHLKRSLELGKVGKEYYQNYVDNFSKDVLNLKKANLSLIKTYLMNAANISQRAKAKANVESSNHKIIIKVLSEDRLDYLSLIGEVNKFIDNYEANENYRLVNYHTLDKDLLSIKVKHAKMTDIQSLKDAYKDVTIDHEDLFRDSLRITKIKIYEKEN